MQTMWSDFHNSRNTNPSVLDAEVSIDPLENPITYQGNKICGLRRVFINTGAY